LSSQRRSLKSKFLSLEITKPHEAPTIHNKVWMQVPPGTRLRATNNGGGWGDPMERRRRQRSA
jgi:hypothetical protein